MTREQVKKFVDAVEIVRFWSIRTPSSDPGGPDGAQWIVEGVRRGHYKIVDVFCAPAHDPIRSLGMMMVLELAGIKVPPNSIY